MYGRDAMEHLDEDLLTLLATDVRQHFQHVVEAYQHRLYTLRAFRLKI